jgi:hypothetical protein
MMDVNKASSTGADSPGELKIKVQAEFERRKSKCQWEAEGDDIVRNVYDDFGFFAYFVSLGLE